MSAETFAAHLDPTRLPLLAQMLRDAPAFTRLGLFLALSLAVTVTAAQIDPRLFQGENIWLKPIKFQIALTLYLLTLAWFSRWLPEGLAQAPGWRLYSAVVALAIIAELLWIGGAAALGTASHFNTSTPLMATLYPLMGLVAVILTSASLATGIAIWRNASPGLPAPLHLALALGLVLTFVLTVPVAGTLANHPGHFVGRPVTGATLWPLGWSREVGDLRVAHFLATHAMHFIPAGGLIAVWLLPEPAARLAVLAGAAAFTALVGFTLWQALNGHPFIG